MYYDDQARRFNFVSGLAMGAVLGVGLALLGAPAPRRRRRLQEVAGGWVGGAGSALRELREGVAGSMADVLQEGRKQLRTRTR